MKIIDILLNLAKFKEEKESYEIVRGTKEVAVDLLGDIRAVEAVPFLVKHIKYRINVVVREDNPILYFPCARALMAIGAPCYQEIFWYRFESTIDDIEIKLFAFIVLLIEGQDLGQARLELERRRVDKLATTAAAQQRKTSTAFWNGIKRAKRDFERLLAFSKNNN